jgi:hypothetical protein
MCFKYTTTGCGIILVLMCCLFTAGCVPNSVDNGGNDSRGDWKEPKEPTLQDLAYNPDRDTPYRIGIEEDGAIVPYLVLSDNYNGNCLLLREYLLDEPMSYNSGGWYASYYENSEIDQYLNGEFIKKFPADLSNKIVDSTIVITAQKSLGIGGKDTTTITRKVFLLSYAELHESGSRTNLKEGEPLDYFKEMSARVAYYNNGQAGSWWLRTANTANRAVVCGVTTDGAVGLGGIGGPGELYLNGVRPAFCLSRDTKVMKNDDGLYVLVQD